MHIMYTYFDHKNQTFPNLLTLPKNLRFGLVSIQHIHITFWMNYHPDFVPYHDFEVPMSLHRNPTNNSYVFFHFFCKIQHRSYILFELYGIGG